jgi:hypothetical protein
MQEAGVADPVESALETVQELRRLVSTVNGRLDGLERRLRDLRSSGAGGR